ncbi:MAG TPA: hypothetical protein VEA69_25155 [Tepidisphaeraceae bacterium]|nr:hypothetical protein [Tepidisphaeraceae bacterium]
MRLPRVILSWAALLAFASWATGFARLAHERLEHGPAGHAHAAHTAAGGPAAAHDGHCHHHDHDRDPDPYDEGDVARHVPVGRAAGAEPDGRPKPADGGDDSHQGCAACVAIGGIVVGGVAVTAALAADDVGDPVAALRHDAPAAHAFAPLPPARGPPAVPSHPL